MRILIASRAGGVRRAAAWLLALTLLLSCAFSSAMADDSRLRYGDKSSAVLELQTALKSLGYKIGTPDGKFGAYTENAVRKFQRSHGLNVDGIAGAQTQAAIYAAAKGKTSSSTASSASASTVSTSASSSGSNGLANYFSGDYSTIEQGQKGTRVLHLQNALRTLGYSLSADGSFGSGTQNAVAAFQKNHGLTADGKAGRKTLKAVENALVSASKAAQAITASAAASASASSSGSVSGTLRPGDSGSSVSNLQQRLKALGWYTGSVDGKYGGGTTSAVIAFQKAASLSVDGVAGSRTVKKLFSSDAPSAKGTSASAASTASSGASSGSSASVSVGQIRLLHWYNDVKPSLRSGQRILVYEPRSGISWTLRVLSLGRHADAEPLTAEDTANMLRAFGGVNTWSQKAVYVRLPSGVWTLASTHDMPHLTGSVKDNNFDGHLCVHFLRDMDEAQRNDPSYGVSNQNTIRSAWKALTGETVN